MIGVSLFANVGIGETYAESNGVRIAVANELLEDRAEFYRKMHPNTCMIQGDITDSLVYSELLAKAKSENCDFLLATPPCQGMSNAGKQIPDDERNLLIKYAVSFINDLSPKYAVIENVPQMLKTPITTKQGLKIIPYYITDVLGDKYKINFRVIDAADYSTPQHRKRAIFLLHQGETFWDFPETEKRITVREAIGDLPSLESGQSSDIPYHNAKAHSEHHVVIMRHTPTGKSAFENEFHYPKRKDGKRVTGFKTTYKRMDWDRPAPTVTMGNGAISSQNNVHPGTRLPDGTYSDARVLTLKELFRVTGLPEDWTPPEDASDSLIRKVIGECLPPKLLSSLLTTIPDKSQKGCKQYEL